MQPQNIHNINAYTRLSIYDIMEYFGVQRSAAYKRRNEMLDFLDRRSKNLCYQDLCDYENLPLAEVVNRILYFNDRQPKIEG